MSKVKEITKQYSNVPSSTSTRFLDADKTPTKKYYQYMMKIWSERKTTNNRCPTVVNSLIEVVVKFEDLIPYIENKDIYSKQYNNFEELVRVIDSAEDLKVMKTFNREEHITLLDESDDYILLIPKTHVASVKYGSNTKWCTASRKDMNVFKRYSNNGVLMYLIDKTNSKKKNYNKVAFYYSSNEESPLTGSLETYDTADSRCTDVQMVSNGWDATLIMKLITLIRLYCVSWEKTKKSNNNIRKVIEILEDINFETLRKDVESLSQTNVKSEIENFRLMVNQFTNKLENFK